MSPDTTSLRLLTFHVPSLQHKSKHDKSQQRRAVALRRRRHSFVILRGRSERAHNDECASTRRRLRGQRPTFDLCHVLLEVQNDE
ncbi:hypothetical protein EVAR_393_1 [Eumeta japonica]|uniref:Uncharacterized protein n=1 Tax=Eumeta variegata TaxID=151549 RepID=A0A4C1SA72_EUMVA|nr:hypothetical protein EVAR_393_1 [Eumeta japonica]